MFNLQVPHSLNESLSKAKVKSKADGCSALEMVSQLLRVLKSLGVAVPNNSEYLATNKSL
jgi:hypothetical protein